MLTQPREIGGIQTTIDRQKQLAVLSRFYECPCCSLKHTDLWCGAMGATNIDTSIFKVKSNGKMTGRRKTNAKSPNIHAGIDRGVRLDEKDQNVRALQGSIVQLRWLRKILTVALSFFVIVIGRLWMASDGGSATKPKHFF